MRKAAVFIALAFQIIVLLVMAGQREYIVLAGERLYLRTAPIDPRDLFRGDFVRLDYALSRVGERQFSDQVALETLHKGMPVYAVLRQDQGAEKVADLDYLTATKPDRDLFIRGRVRSTYQGVNIAYGIEAYFVEQGKGQEIEKKRGARDGMQIPMEVELAVSRSGTAVITGHRWSRLGMALQVTSVALAERSDRVADLSLKLILKNVAVKPLALLNLLDQCSFDLVATALTTQDWRADSDHCNRIRPTDADVIMLEPGQEHVFEFLLSDSRWRLGINAQGLAISVMDLPNERFRMVYRAPPASALIHLAQKELLWHGRLPSRAFSGRGRID